MARHLVERMFQSGGISINYVEGPEGGPPLVLLHGLAGRWQTFMPLILALRQEWHVYALDLRGHGRSGRAPGHYRLDDYVADVAAFVQTEVGEESCLFGHSLGGWIAMSLTARLPQAVRGLVIGDSAIYPGSIDPAASPSYFTHVPIALRGLTTASSQLDPEALAMLYYGRLLAGYDPDTLLASIACPVLLLQADPRRGGVMTDCDVERSRRLLAQPACVRLHNVGHGLHMEHASPVCEPVTSFLKSLSNKHVLPQGSRGSHQRPDGAK